jgi:hypothetical protein
MTDEGGKGKREKNEQKDRVVNPGSKKVPVRRRITVFGSRIRKECKYFENVEKTKKGEKFGLSRISEIVV